MYLNPSSEPGLAGLEEELHFRRSLSWKWPRGCHRGRPAPAIAAVWGWAMESVNAMLAYGAGAREVAPYAAAFLALTAVSLGVAVRRLRP